MKKNKSKMNVRFTSYWTIGVIIMFSASVNAQSTKWVDQSGGNDANDGNTEATAYASLQYAVDNSISGTSTTQSVINVKDGTYEATGLINSGGFSTALLISSLDYLTIQAVSGHNPQVKPSTAANIVSVSLDNSDHIIIDNIDSDQTVAQFDNYHVNNSDDITVKNCTFEGGEDGIDFNSDLTSALIENNTFLNIVNGSGDEVLDFTDASYSGVTIQDNLFENNYRHITLNEGSGKTISNFIIRRNTMNGTTSEEAIRLIGVSDIILENNVILNNLQQGIYIDTGCSNITIQHNSFYNNDQEAAGNGEIRTKVTTADIIVKNNIFYANGSNPVFETSVSSLPGEDFNLVYNYGGTFTFSPNTIDGIDPEFMSIVPGSEDLHLQNTSIAIGAGTNLGVSDDHDQNARPQPVASNPDLGAYESGNDVPVPVELTSFAAQAVAGGVEITWATASETENLGYNIYRANEENGTYAKINGSLIAGQGNSAETTNYSFVDANVVSGTTYYYKLADVNYSGVQTFHGPLAVTVSGVTGVAEGAVPTEFALGQNYPNPFNPTTTIEFSLAEAGHAKLCVYNAAGQLVSELVNGQYAVGSHTVKWNAVDGNGNRVASGLYLYRLETGGKVMQKKLVLMK